MNTELCYENLKERDTWENQGVTKSIKLKWILEK